MTQADPKEHERDDGQSDALQISLGLVGNDGDGGDRADSQRGKRGKQGIPIINCGKINEEDAEDDHQTFQPLAEKAGGAGEFAVAGQTENRYGNHRGGRAEENRADDQRGENQPGKVSFPKLAAQLVVELSLALKNSKYHRRQDENHGGSDRQAKHEPRIKSMIESEKSLPGNLIHADPLSFLAMCSNRRQAVRKL